MVRSEPLQGFDGVEFQLQMFPIYCLLRCQPEKNQIPGGASS